VCKCGVNPNSKERREAKSNEKHCVDRYLEPTQLLQEYLHRAVDGARQRRENREVSRLAHHGSYYWNSVYL